MSAFRRHWIWLLALAVLLAFPFLFYDWTKGRHSGFVLTLMSCLLYTSDAADEL